MPYEVQIIEVEARPLAAIAAQFSVREVPTRLLSVLSDVWNFVRSNRLTPTGQNVVLFDELGMTAAGVELFADLPADERVLSLATPAGRAATAVFWGDYTGTPAVHRAIREWCSSNGQELVGTNWEIYGDWSDDPAQRRTDIFYLLA